MRTLGSVGWLSRIEPALRPNPAGPPLPVTGAQMLGRRVLEYAVMPHRGGWEEAQLHRVADDVVLPLERAPVNGGGRGPRTGSLLEIDGAQVSACHRDRGSLILRIFNPGTEATTARVRLQGEPASGWVVDLRGRPIVSFEGEVELGSAHFVTLQIPPDSP